MPTTQTVFQRIDTKYRITLKYVSAHNLVAQLWMGQPSDFVAGPLEICTLATDVDTEQSDLRNADCVMCLVRSQTF